MPALLAAPITVWTSLDSTGTSLTTNWTDPNGPALVSNFSVTFQSRGTKPAFTPNPSATSNYATSLTIPAQSGQPSVSDLAANYIANVTANPANATANTASSPGQQIFAFSNSAVTLTLAGRQFTLTPSAANPGVYTLSPLPSGATFSLADITAFAGLNGIAAANVPQTLPNGTPITGTLSLSKLAVNPVLGLFDVAASLSLGTAGWSLFPGFSINQIALNVQRTDGVHTL